MNITRCYKYRLEPTSQQEHTFLVFAGCRRFVWNWALQRKHDVYKATLKSIGYNALVAELVSFKKLDALFLKDCQAQLLQQTLMDLEKAFKAFFEKRARFPRFKSRKRTSHAFRMPQNVTVVDGKVSIPKIGLIKARIHREMEGDVKSATIKQESDGHWYVVFVSHIELPDVPCLSNKPCGIDVGLSTFATLDNGTKIQPPKFYRKGQSKLRRLQRKHSRCQKTSKNRIKAKVHVARFHNRVANRRNDFLHKISRQIVNQYDTICIENLNLKGLVRTKLAKSFSDAAIGNFLRMLEYKAQWQNNQVVKVGRFFPSSKTCHCCQHIQHLELSDRTWTCTQCGVVHDRDHNAAINILSEGLRILAVGSTDNSNDSGEGVRLAMASNLR